MQHSTAFHSVITLALLALPALGQPAEVTGRVTENVHGKPLPDIGVILAGQDYSGMPPMVDTYSTHTDAEGRFRISNVAPGKYLVEYDAPLYTPPVSNDGIILVRPPIQLLPREQRQLELQLTPAGILSGRVVDADGDPVRRAWVRAMQPTYDQGKRELTVRRNAVTDDRGEYRFQLPPGTYYIQSSGPLPGQVMGGEIRGARSAEGFLTSYYPNGRDAGAAEPVGLKPGAEAAHIDMRLFRGKFYRVRAKVSETTPGASGRFTLLQPSRRMAWRANGQPGGTIEFIGVLPGTYLLTGSMDKRDGHAAYVRTEVEVTDHDVEIDPLPVMTAFDVTGTLKVEGTLPYPMGDIGVTLRSINPYAYDDGDSTGATDEGAMVFHNLFRESYQLTVNIPPGAYLMSLKLGAGELPDTSVDLSRGPEPLTVILGADGGSIRGIVEGRSGFVTIFPEGRDAAHSLRAKAATADAEGKFAIHDIAPGEYRVFAWSGHDPLASDPQYRKRFEEQSVTVTVAPHADLELSLKPVGRHLE